jgi:hypothetical protein
MADHEERDLRRELALLERGRGKRYPAGLQRRIVAWARREIARGQSARELARRLAVHRGTLQVWLDDAAAASALVPVEVVAEPSAAGWTTTRPRTVSVSSPSGFRVDGLTLDEAATLLARLR